MTRWQPPLTADGKWRITPEQFFEYPILPHYVDAYFDTDDTDEDNRVVLVALDNYGIDERAPRLSHAVYKWHTFQWFILWRRTASWSEKRCIAHAYRPLIRVKATSRPATIGAGVLDHMLRWSGPAINRMPKQDNPTQESNILTCPD